MENLVWSSEMSVGSDELDCQHKHLFSLYNNLLVVISNDVANKIFRLSDDVLQGFVDYAGLHFEYEEGIMIKAGYHDIYLHKLEHKTYINRMLEAQSELNKNSDPKEWEELCKFLSSWIVNHIMGTDRLYTPYIRSVSV